MNDINKIILNKRSDLINIPIQELRTAQIKNFSGKLFEQIYKEAIDIEHKQIYVFNGKGGDRIVPLPDQAIELIKIWLQIRPEWKNNNYLFTNVKGTTRPGKTRPISQKYFNQLFEKLANETGIKLRDGSLPHPHTLRHSRAMELYDNVGDLQLIQTLLGHKNIATTQIYAQVRDEKVAEMQNAITGGLINL